MIFEPEDFNKMKRATTRRKAIHEAESKRLSRERVLNNPDMWELDSGPKIDIDGRPDSIDDFEIELEQIEQFEQ